jgi:hypothetical protein
LWQFVYHHHCNFLEQRTYKWGMRMSAISCCKQRTYRCAPGCLAELTLLIYKTFVYHFDHEVACQILSSASTHNHRRQKRAGNLQFCCSLTELCSKLLHLCLHM